MYSYPDASNESIGRARAPARLGLVVVPMLLLCAPSIAPEQLSEKILFRCTSSGLVTFSLESVCNSYMTAGIRPSTIWSTALDAIRRDRVEDDERELYTRYGCTP